MPSHLAFAPVAITSPSATDGEEANESALAELTEFVRVGVQLVFDELEPLRERHIPPGHVLH